MLFNSPQFVLGFLPAALAGFFLLGRIGGQRWAIGWLVAASLFFYGWWWSDRVKIYQYYQCIVMVSGNRGKTLGYIDFWASPDAGEYDSLAACHRRPIHPVYRMPSWQLWS
jgi:hypothetical protein